MDEAASPPGDPLARPDAEWNARIVEGTTLLEGARARGLLLRLAGSAGIRAHCEDCHRLLEAIGREPPGDLDFFAYSKQQRDLERMLRELGYRPDPSVAFSQEYGVQRLIYHGSSTGTKVDVFLDVLRMSHTIAFAGRLELAEPTVPLADLLVAKLQIHEITEKDLKDVTSLLAVHGLGEADGGAIDASYLVGLMRRDWSLYHSSLGNLEVLERVRPSWDLLDEARRSAVVSRIAELRRRIEDEPKGLRWRLRARVGPRLRWYEDVGSAEEGGQGDAGLSGR